MSISAGPGVETSGLYRRYGRRWALVGLELTIPRGTRCMVAGPNGSGKSTLLRVLSGALRPSLGSARVEGLEVSRHRREVRRRVAMLSHRLYHYRALTALENLQVAARFLGAPSHRRDLEPFLARVDLAHRGDDPVATFSAGMCKRLALARLLLQVEPPTGARPPSGASVVLLDEPYGELDAAGFRFVDALLEDLHGGGVTVLMATHLLDRGARFCDLGILLHAGRKVWQGVARELPGVGAGAGEMATAGEAG